MRRDKKEKNVKKIVELKEDIPRSKKKSRVF
jgi:hypothetical protein